MLNGRTRSIARNPLKSQGHGICPSRSEGPVGAASAGPMGARHQVPAPVARKTMRNRPPTDGHLGRRTFHEVEVNAGAWIGTTVDAPTLVEQQPVTREQRPGLAQPFNDKEPETLAERAARAAGPAPIQRDDVDDDGACDDDPAGLRSWKPKPVAALATLHLLPAPAVELTHNEGDDDMNSKVLQHILENTGTVDDVAKALANAGCAVKSVASYRHSGGALDVIQLEALRASGIITITRERPPSAGRAAWLGAWSSVPTNRETDAMARAAFGEAPTGAALVGLVLLALTSQPRASMTDAAVAA